MFCGDCTPYRVPLSSNPIFKHRVCRECFTFLTSYDSPLAHLVPSISPVRSGHRASRSESLLNECPVCQQSLSSARLSEEQAATHLAQCLDRVNGGGSSRPVIAGNMYLTQNLEESLESECLICFEEFLKGISLLTLLFFL